MALGTGTLATISYAAWFTYRELPRVSPDIAEAYLPLNAAGTVFLAAVVITLAFTLALRLSIGPSSKEGDVIGWRRRVAYLHESRVVAVLAIALASYEVCLLHQPFRGLILSDLPDAVHELIWFGSFSGLTRTIGRALLWPPAWLWLAMGLVALRLTFQRKSTREAAADCRLNGIAPARFVLTLILAACVVTSGLLTLTAFSFAFWFGPWNH